MSNCVIVGVRRLAASWLILSSLGALNTVDGASVLFVTDEFQHIEGDETVLERLEFLGHSVDVVDHLEVDGVDAVAQGVELIVISASVTSGNVLDYFSEDPIPLINWEENLWDDLYMSDRGEGSGDQDMIDVVDISHPLAAMMGLDEVGELPVREGLGYNHYGGVGNKAPGLHVIAREFGGDRTAIGVIDAGGELNDGSLAAATRIGLYYNEDALLLANDEGLAIFDGAVSYALRDGMTLPGDFDGDGLLTTVDIDLLTAASAAGNHDPAFDLNNDKLVNEQEVSIWVKELKTTWIGDADLSDEFNSSDLVLVLAAGTYETATDAVWTTGDFNGDGRSNSADLVSALADGGYEQGPRGAVVAVPEPTAMLITLCGGLLCVNGSLRRGLKRCH